jgi:hypothetical protein
MMGPDAAAVATWGCDSGTSQLPPWLQSPQPLHWVGGLFTPGTDPSEAFRPFRLVHEFDGIVFFPVVTAEPLTDDRARR